MESRSVLKKLKRIPEVRVATIEELHRLSLSTLKVPTLNWRVTDLGHDDESEVEEAGEIKLTGVWRYVPSWADPADDWSPVGQWNLRPPVFRPGTVTESTEALSAYGDEEEEGEGAYPYFFPRAPLIRNRRQRSCQGRLETFSDKVGKKGADTGGSFLDCKLVEPLSEIFKRPRFVYETESDGEESRAQENRGNQGNREMRLVNFHDNSVIETQFRAPRRAAAGGNERLETAEEEEEDIEDILSLEVLELLQPHAMGRALSFSEYQAIFGKVLDIPQRDLPKCVGELFTKIDTFGLGKITWDDFCDFLQQKYAERAETQYTSPAIDVVTPCKPFETVHRSPVTRAITLPDRGLLTFSEDGIVSLFESDFTPGIWRALGRPAGLKSSQQINDKKANKWYTDIVHVHEVGKYIVSTGEKELQFYDNSTYDPYCQIAHLYSISIHLDAKVTGTGLVIVMGDTEGNVTILEIAETISTLRYWSHQRRIQNIATIYVHEAVGLDKGVKYIKHKVHNDMVTNVIFLPTMMRFVSGSADPRKALIMQRIQDFKSANAIMEDLSAGYVEGVTDINAKPRMFVSVDTVRFPLKDGCRSFDVWEEKRLVAAGGLDRTVWVWNLYCPKQPVAKLRGHNGSIFRVVFEMVSDTLFSVCTDRVIRVWTLYTNTCIHIIDEDMIGLRGPALYCFFPTTEAIFIQTSAEASYLPLKRKGDDGMVEGMTHIDGITAIKYNPQMEYFITCSTEDIFVWDCKTGKQVNEFNTIGGDGSMHLDQIASKSSGEAVSNFVLPKPLLHGREQVDTYEVGPVTAVALDSFGRRFFTAHSNGVIKAWNFYNGRNLYNLYKPLNNKSICDMSYITVNEAHRYLVTVGCDRRVVIYIDSQGPEVLAYSGLPDTPLILDDEKVNHENDILALSFGYPHLLASGDVNGRILVWNLNSGRVVARLKANKCHDKGSSKDPFVTALTFFERTWRKSKTTYLIAAGPFHLIHIWRANTTRELNVGSVGWVRPCAIPSDSVTAMKCCKGNSNLVTADTSGAVSIWEIEDMLGDSEPTEWFSQDQKIHGRNKLTTVHRGSVTDPQLGHKDQGYGKGPVQLRFLRSWKCHVDGFQALEICETYGLIATGAKDCSVRIWDMQGQYLGVLGQDAHWHVGDTASYQKWFPKDVILDMKRIREHGVFSRPNPPKLDIEIAAENRTRGLEQKRHHHLSERDISKMAYRYQSLGTLNTVTQTWFMANAPVGPHRRVGERPDTGALVPIPGTLKKVKGRRKYESEEDTRACVQARRHRNNAKQVPAPAPKSKRS